MSLRSRARGVINFLTFWKGDKTVPGVADAERRTRAAQEQRGRKYNRENLLKLIKEGRLHEADAEQVEQIKLALELNELLGRPAESNGIDADTLAIALKEALTEVVSSISNSSGGGVGTGLVKPTSRPGMKHTSLTSIAHKDSEVSISHGDTLAEESEGEEDAAAKLRRLREIKGSK